MAASQPAQFDDPLRPAFLPEDSQVAHPGRTRQASLAMAWQLPAFAAALTTLVIVVASLLPGRRLDRTPTQLLLDIRDRLDRRQYAAATDLVALFLRTYRTPGPERSSAHFYWGRALRESALAMDVPPRDLLEQARQTFDDACTMALPGKERESALLWAGDCLERLNQPAEAAARYLEGAGLGGALAGTLRLALIRVWSASPAPDLDATGKHLEAALADPGPSAAEKAAGLLNAGQAAFRMERWEEAERCVTRLAERFGDAPAAGEAHLLLARLALRAGRYDEALAEARQYLAQAAQTDESAVVAAFVLADSLLGSGRPGEALTAFRHLALDFPETAEGQAAALRGVLCHVRLEAGPDALEALKALLAGPPRAWARNPWTTEKGHTPAAVVEELRRFFFVRSQYRQVVELTHAARGLLPRTVYLETLATVERLLAEQEVRLAGAGGEGAPGHREEARRALIRAGDALVALADATRTERTFVEHLWSAAECYRQAQAFSAAAQTLETFIRNAFVAGVPEGERYAQAHYYLGECHAALGRPAEAIAVFKRVVRDCPRNAYAYLARLAWAHCCLTLNRLDEAETVLVAIVENTEGDVFTPRSTVWRRALFLLGETLHRGGKYPEAIRRLAEAVARFPEDPEAQGGRYLLAESHRAIALRLDLAHPPPGARAPQTALGDEGRAHLAEAIALYRALMDRHEARAKAGEALDALDETRCRNSAFFLGDCHFELEQHGQAIAAYEEAAFRYRDDPRALSAFVQMSEALRRQRKEELARAAVEKARWVLRNVQGEDLEKRPAGLTRDQWMAWLDWASRLK